MNPRQPQVLGDLAEFGHEKGLLTKASIAGVGGFRQAAHSWAAYRIPARPNFRHFRTVSIFLGKSEVRTY